MGWASPSPRPHPTPGPAEDLGAPPLGAPWGRRRGPPDLGTEAPRRGAKMHDPLARHLPPLPEGTLPSKYLLAWGVRGPFRGGIFGPKNPWGGDGKSSIPPLRSSGPPGPRRDRVRPPPNPGPREAPRSGRGPGSSGAPGGPGGAEGRGLGRPSRHGRGPRGAGGGRRIWGANPTVGGQKCMTLWRGLYPPRQKVLCEQSTSRRGG